MNLAEALVLQLYAANGPNCKHFGACGHVTRCEWKAAGEADSDGDCAHLPGHVALLGDVEGLVLKKINP